MAQISDNDPIFEQLEQWHNEDEYQKILDKIEEIPEEERSNKLMFLKISALNNLKRFDEAKKELSLFSQKCTEPYEFARLFYMLGYIYDNTNCEMKAVECYRNTKSLDPDFEGIQDLLDGSMKCVNRDLEAAGNAFAKLFPDVSDAIEKAEAPLKLDAEDALPYIALVEASFITSRLGIKLPLDKMFFKCDEADKPRVKAFLEQVYGIRDIESLRQWYGNNRHAYQFARMTAAMKENKKLPTKGLKIAERVCYDATNLIISYMKDLLPEAGIAAWDYSTVLALTRLAYSCDILTNTEFGETFIFFSDECKKNFSSWEEFTRSTVIGGFYNAACFETPYDIKTATRFGVGAGVLCMQTYPHVTWIG